VNVLECVTHSCLNLLAAQPPLIPATPFVLEREDGAYSPVDQAIRNALHEAA
jgi:hypothetical protein